MLEGGGCLLGPSQPTASTSAASINLHLMKATTAHPQMCAQASCLPLCSAHMPTWGSMHSGQRRELVSMMALSMEKVSLGRPAMTQLRTRTGSASASAREYLDEMARPTCRYRCRGWPLAHSIASGAAEVCALGKKRERHLLAALGAQPR